MPTDNYIEKTSIPGCVISRRPVYNDDRGFFRETFRINDIEAESGIELKITQANHSRSSQGTLRGIHIAPWHKLVTVARGQVQQVVVDMREDSPTFGTYVSITMGEEDQCTVLVPAGCGNSFLVLSETADYTYATTGYWEPGKEQSVRYDDPDLAISWHVNEPHLSEKDLANPTARALFPTKFN